MIVGVCGNGYCGSSAVTDYLRENKDLAVSPYDIEFTFLYDVDGIDDLKHHIVDRPVRFYSSDAAIKRYRQLIKSMYTPNSQMRKICGDALSVLTEEYLSKITQLTWHGWWHYDIRTANTWTRNWNFRFLVRLNNIIQHYLKRLLDFSPNSNMYLSINPENFDDYTKEYVAKIIKLFNLDDKHVVVLDQPYPVGMHDTYASYFEDCIKTVNVIRDPRDVFVAAKKVNSSFSSWIPTNNVKDFVKYFKLTCAFDEEHMCKEELLIRFEDLIYRYDETTNRIDDFIGIPSTKEKLFFDPNRSINNTQLFRKYVELSEDIKYIERELSDYLYDFEKMGITPDWKNSF